MCDRYRDGKCISRYCHYLSAGDTCLNPKMKPNPTNADKIRGMSDEELAEFLWEQNGSNRYWKSVGKYLDWLRQPAETEGKE